MTISQRDDVPADLIEFYDGNVVRRNANCSFVVEETDPTVMGSRCKACKGEKSDPLEPEIVILSEEKCNEKPPVSTERTPKRSPKMKQPKIKRAPMKKQFQCPICDKFLSSGANLRQASYLATFLVLIKLSCPNLVKVHDINIHAIL